MANRYLPKVEYLCTCTNDRRPGRPHMLSCSRSGLGVSRVKRLRDKRKRLCGKTSIPLKDLL